MKQRKIDQTWRICEHNLCLRLQKDKEVLVWKLQKTALIGQYECTVCPLVQSEAITKIGFLDIQYLWAKVNCFSHTFLYLSSFIFILQERSFKYQAII